VEVEHLDKEMMEEVQLDKHLNLEIMEEAVEPLQLEEMHQEQDHQHQLE
jgi:hypothetical protein